MYLRYFVKMKHHISYFYNALLEYYQLHQAWCETQSSSTTEKTNWQSLRYIKNVRHWHEHKHPSVLAIGQLRQRLLQASPHMQQTLSQLINVVNVTVTSYLRHV